MILDLDFSKLECIDELENYPDPQDPTATINMIALFDKYLARYAELEAAEADANVATTGVIALIDALTAKELIVLVVDKPFVEAARDAYDLWIDTFFTNAVTGSYDHTDVKEALNTDIDSIWIAVFYSAGFATGTFLGGKLSQKSKSNSL